MKRILVVDDEGGIRNVCRRALAAPDMEIETAASGDEALGRMDQGWDLVLTDLAMPGTADGVEVLRQARGRGASVILMSAYPDLGSTLAAVHHRAFDFLVKPFSIEELRGAIARWQASSDDSAVSRAARLKPWTVPEPQHEPQLATSLFADIRGFSRFSASAPPGEVGEALAELLGPAMEAVRESGGAVQQVLGDGFLALFGGGGEEGAAAAAAAALTCRKIVADISARRARAGRAPLPMGFGLETGLVRAESLGGIGRGQPTIIGHSVNLAARLEKAAGPGEILIGPEAAVKLLGRYRLDPIAPLALHGFDEPTPAFHLLDF